MTQAYSGDRGGPTALRMRVGARLRRYRLARQISREDAGWHIRASESKISRMELGRVPFKERDVADLLTLYGVDGAERQELLTLVRQANAPAWWQSLADVVPPWSTAFLGLEQAASLIRTYDLHFVPALLQTPEYARALLEMSCAAPPEELDRRVHLRQLRQRVLRGTSPAVLWAAVDEAALHRELGGPEVMRRQLEALAEACRAPNIRLHIGSFRVDALATAAVPFTLLRFAEPELPDTVYLEQPTGATYVDRPVDVEQYTLAVDRACAGATPPDRAASVIEEVLRTYAALAMP
ncbi:helix-turn-helix transcriptional regulator [Actinoplanes sp. DH11]|uniref:helix-turn-helix domain-containing protein n=1 Tax=Actinoplanes sp. DH11 TaxID=2857011 RepID=UPI001E614BE1|nr:helix-turn-helix transcriptional regulator [Actinoplanes sp. DH11]